MKTYIISVFKKKLMCSDIKFYVTLILKNIILFPNYFMWLLIGYVAMHCYSKCKRTMLRIFSLTGGAI